MKRIALSLPLLLAAMNSHGAIKFQPVEYQQNGTVLEGLSVYDDAVQGKRPGVLIAHQWKGLGEDERKRAEMLAKLGYNVLAVDIYGKGIRPSTREEAAAQAGKFKSDRPLLKERIRALWSCSKSTSSPIPAALPRSATASAERRCLNWLGAGLKLPALLASTAGWERLIRRKPPTSNAKFSPCTALTTRTSREVKFKRSRTKCAEPGSIGNSSAYGGAVHSFTDWNAGTDNSKGAAYNERADRRSWEAMKQFFAEIFR